MKGWMFIKLKKMNLSVESLYKQYDPEGHNFVFRSDFIDVSYINNFEFSEEELNKIFEEICANDPMN